MADGEVVVGPAPARPFGMCQFVLGLAQLMRRQEGPLVLADLPPGMLRDTAMALHREVPDLFPSTLTRLDLALTSVRMAALPRGEAFKDELIGVVRAMAAREIPYWPINAPEMEILRKLAPIRRISTVCLLWVAESAAPWTDANPDSPGEPAPARGGREKLGAISDHNEAYLRELGSAARFVSSLRVRGAVPVRGAYALVKPLAPLVRLLACGLDVDEATKDMSPDARQVFRNAIFASAYQMGLCERGEKDWRRHGGIARNAARVRGRVTLLPEVIDALLAEGLDLEQAMALCALHYPAGAGVGDYN